MRNLGVYILCLLSFPAFGQRRERSILRPELKKELAVSDSTYSPMTRAMNRATRKAVAGASNAAVVPQAPGILQINNADTDNSAWFVVTDVIPQGASFIAYIAPAGPNFLKLGPYTFNRAVMPGESIALPKISNFGDFWPDGVTTYDVVINLNGTDTHCAADFTLGTGRNYNDLGVVQPIIYNYAESLSNRSVMLAITGWFTSDPVKVVLEDLVVPPASIMQSRDGSTVTVNLSQVPGLHLDVYQHLLLSVAQAGFSDTSVFTHVPFNPANYDPAPPLN